MPLIDLTPRPQEYPGQYCYLCIDCEHVLVRQPGDQCILCRDAEHRTWERRTGWAAPAAR